MIKITSNLKRILIAVLIIGLMIISFFLGRRIDMFSSREAVNTVSYIDFEKAYSDLDEKFRPSQFELIEESRQKFSSITIPDNCMFNSKDDNYEGNALKPKNRKLLYKDKLGKTLISVNYLYTDMELNQDLVTIDTFPVGIVEKVLENKDVNLPHSYEFIITYKNFIILIKCNYIGTDEYNDEISEYFTSNVREFFKEYTEYLNDY